ncbi:MAG: PAS domain S-box protein [Actinomycetota bacterium]
MEKKLKILMLDANPADAGAVEAELVKAGISFASQRVETKSDFESALSGFEPDLVLSDYWLPTFDGVSALNLVKQVAPEVPFIFVSGALGEELAVDALTGGAADYVLKIGLSRLVPAVRRALRESEERAERERLEQDRAESEERMRTILDSVQTGVVIVDCETQQIIDVNPAAALMIGYPEERMRGEHCSLFSPCGRRKKCPALSGGPDGESGENVVVTASGRRLPVQKTVTSVVLGGRRHFLESFVDLSPSRRMEEALRESEEAFRAFLGVPMGSVLMLDSAMKILAINEVAARRLGHSVDGLVGSKLSDVFPADVSKRMRARVKEVVDSGNPVNYEDQHKGIFTDNSLFPVFDSKGKVSRVVVFAQDITDRKSVEEAQKKDRDFIGKVLNTAGALVVVRERQGRIVLFNRTAEETTGYSFEEVDGRHEWEVFLKDSDEARQSRAAFKKLLSGLALPEYEVHWTTRSGASRLLSVSNATLLDASGQAEYVITTGIDITDSRRAEEALKSSEERYRTVFESTGSAMCIVESDSAISFLNHEFERISGYKPAEVIGKKKFTDFLAGEQVASFRVLQEELGVLEGKESTHFECDFQARDRPLKMLGSIGLMPGSEASAVSLIDVTQEKLYEQELKERAERLRDFLVVASHELRHPVAIVKGYANTLLEYIDRMSPELIQEILHDVDISTDRLTRYVEQLMDVSRVEQGRLQVQRLESDMDMLIKMAVEDMRVMGFSNEFSIRLAVPSAPVEIDPEKFLQLLGILLDNAVKFSPEGSPIEIQVERDTDEVTVSVLDRGRGIPEEDRALVFDRFYQVEDVAHHSKPGMGLGLYIACRIAEAHGGAIEVRGREGGGSVFRFTLSTG